VPVKSTIAKIIKNERTLRKLRGTWWNVSISALKWMDIISSTYCEYRLVV
jgi:hypothetical protein